MSELFGGPILYHPITGHCYVAFSQMLPYWNCIKSNDSGNTKIGSFGIVPRSILESFRRMSFKSVWENISWDVPGKTKIGKMWVSEWRGRPLILLMRLASASLRHLYSVFHICILYFIFSGVFCICISCAFACLIEFIFFQRGCQLILLMRLASASLRHLCFIFVFCISI